MTEPVKVEPVAEPAIEAPNQTVEEMAAEIRRLKEHNAKVLGEKKAIKADLDAELSVREQKKQDDLKAKEDYKTISEEAQQKIEKLEAALTKRQENSLSKSIAFNVQKLASDAIDIGDILDKINIGEDNIDMENETVTDLSAQIDEIRKNKPYLFDTKKSTMTTKLPNMGNISHGKVEDKRSPAERVADQILNT